VADRPTFEVLKTRQAMCGKVTLRRFRATIVVAEKQ
jgi:hypothetical protein